jgi:hypothetical protein
VPIFTDPFAMIDPFDPGLRHTAPLRATPSARAVGPVADDAHDVRVEIRIDAVDTNRPDYDVVPEHDPDGTPWAA